MDFTISALAAERVADLRRDLPPPFPGGPPPRTPLRHLLGRAWTAVGARRLRYARAAASRFGYPRPVPDRPT